MKTSAVIPACDEEPTIGHVVDAATNAKLIDEVVVVDNCSQDKTSATAAAHGARVVAHAHPGKGGAMSAGVKATEAQVIVFLDGDLIGLRQDHVDALVHPILEKSAGMACGLFDRAPC